MKPNNFPISTIINYSTNEYRFIRHAIAHAAEFSVEIIVPVCERFFDNQPEDESLLFQTVQENPKARFIRFPFISEIAPKRLGPHFWPNLARWVGIGHVSAPSKYILFLDADEIIDSHRFMEWLSTNEYQKHDSIQFSNYWYFRSIEHRALQTEAIAVMVHRDSITAERAFSRLERHQLFTHGLRNAVGLDGLPMIHHYSWVRTKEEMLRKVRSWSHREGRDWVALVEKEFSGPFSGKDFVHNYDFDSVEPYVQIDMNPIQRIELKAVNHRTFISSTPRLYLT